MTVPDEQFKALKQVWSTWLQMDSGDLSWVPEARRRAFKDDEGANEGVSNYLAAIPAKHKKSVSKWFQNGVLLPYETALPRVNVTLTGSHLLLRASAFTYCVPSNVLPFSSWDYKNANAHCAVPSLQEMYSQYVSHVLVQCAGRLVSDQVKLHFVLSDCLEIAPFLPDGLTFDRVSTSNLCDYLPLPTLLKMCRGLLNPANRSSMILTESCNWFYRFSEILVRIQLDFTFGLAQATAMGDTGDVKLVEHSGRTAFVEYYSFSNQFGKYLRASLLLDKSEGLDGKKTVPSARTMALRYGLVLRDYRHNKNRISPFRWPINCRRVTQLNGFERAVEWVLATDG